MRIRNFMFKELDDEKRFMNFELHFLFLFFFHTGIQQVLILIMQLQSMPFSQALNKHISMKTEGFH